MLLELQRYEVEMQFCPDKDLILAYALGRAYIARSTQQEFSEEIALLVMTDAEQAAETHLITFVHSSIHSKKRGRPGLCILPHVVHRRCHFEHVLWSASTARRCSKK